jgi:hypothetical protein
MSLFSKIENEIREFVEGQTEIHDGYNFSQWKLIKRIVLYMNQVYPKGKVDSQGNYKYWFDIISPRIDSEVKNVDFDVKDIVVYSTGDNDDARIHISNAYLKDWLKKTGQSEDLNEIVEEGSGWGNVVLKRLKKDYEICDLRNLYVVNQTAFSLKDSPVIERHIMTQSQLREKRGVWKNIDEAIKGCAEKSLATTVTTGQVADKETPYYEVFERNGEVSTQDLAEAQGKSGGSEDEYILAKIVACGIRRTGGSPQLKYVLYADKISEMPYKEYHRGRYQGRWLRQGLYEILMDCQTRANEIGNQIARGLEWSSKTIFASSDKVIANNILTDLNSGDIIRSVDLRQVPVRMEGLDQLIADWNRVMELADRLANSYEVVTGESMPSGTPFRLGAMLNQNANKLFDYIREKLTITMRDLIEDWILPEILSDLKQEEVILLTGDEQWRERYYEMLVQDWYLKNLVNFGPHTQQEADMIKEFQLDQLMKKENVRIKAEKSYWTSFEPRIRVELGGERVALMAELETLANFIALENDTVRRTALIELAMKKKGIDVDSLPKTPPEALMPQQAQVASPPQAGAGLVPPQPQSFNQGQ